MAEIVQQGIASDIAETVDQAMAVAEKIGYPVIVRPAFTLGGAGGGAANSGLRDGSAEAGRRRGWRTFLPEFKFTTDNAAMIAMAGYYRYLRGDFSSLDVSPVARLEEL